MINWIRKFFIKTPYVCCMELHNILECYLSLKIPSIGPIEGFRGFFHENHFMIGHRMFDPEWDDSIKLEEIYKKLILIYIFFVNLLLLLFKINIFLQMEAILNPISIIVVVIY
mgnify:CR=1 FL=1